MKLTLPAYSAVTLWLPGDRLLVAKMATPLLITAVPISLPDSMKETVPTVIDGVSVAVNCTGCP